MCKEYALLGVVGALEISGRGLRNQQNSMGNFDRPVFVGEKGLGFRGLGCRSRWNKIGEGSGLTRYTKVMCTSF